MTRWAIYTTVTGALQTTFVSETHPRFNGFAWDGATMTATSTGIPADYDPATFLWSATSKAFAEDSSAVEALLILKVKAANEALVKGAYSQNYGKQKKYSRKQQEVMDFRALTPVVGGVTDATSAALSVFVAPFSTMTTSSKKKKFRFAMAQAAKRGVAIDVIIGEFEAAIDNYETKVANWEAIELEAIRAIKAAPTAAAKRAAYAAIDWTWAAS